MELRTDKQVQSIIKNIVAACKDIEKLNKTGYDFINLASGFIAHYNLNGFIGYYENRSLKADIECYKNENQWNNFRKGEINYDYHMQKKYIYNQICSEIGI